MIGVIVRLVTAMLALGACTSTVASEPDRFPEFSREHAEPGVVVASVRQGKYLPDFEECKRPDVICMDPPPFWFHAEVLSTVHGDEIGDTLMVATTSHYGMENFVDAASGSPVLLALLSHEGRYVMPRYASADLARDKHGELHLLVLRRQPLHWLPCSTWSLKKQILADDFPGSISLSRSDASYLLDDAPELFVDAKGRIVPRYAIALRDLKAHLDARAPTAAQMQCEATDAA